MEPERWKKLEVIFHGALALDAGERAAFVEQACEGDEALQREALSLLAESKDGDGFLEKPAMEVAAKDLASSVDHEDGLARAALPSMIGRYRIRCMLGEGGMGTVYEAEQEDPRRIVALKVIRPGLATPERLRRFRHESQALGRLQHPGIAQIYEASTADAGFGPQPYFAMEFVRGLALDKYAGSHQLSVRQKLALMVRICEAVHHAHQRGLIHRDLKPGNILVDESGQPKVLDFGVARVIEEEAAPTIQTEEGQIVGTLAYMSPEQVIGDPAGVDTRSDIYSLGVILYELLSGRSPYQISGRPIHEAVQIIRDTDPPSLSSMERAYRGDIETIVGKALERDKARRYESAAALATDIELYLKDQPISARPPSATYQLRKFARRHRALVLGIAAIFLVLVAGIAVSTVLAIRARRAERIAIDERDRASRERDRASRITDFMTGMFKVPDPSEARGNSVTAREILDRAANDLSSGLSRDPDAQSQMMKVIAGTDANLGLLPRALALAQTSWEIRRKAFGVDDPRTLESMTQVGTVLEHEGKLDEAEKLVRTAFDSERRVLGSEDGQTLDSMNELVIIVGSEGRFDEAEKLDREQIGILAGIKEPDEAKIFAARTNLAGLLSVQARFSEAEQENRLLVEMGILKWGEDHPRTLAVKENLAMTLQQADRPAEAEQIFRDVLSVRKRIQGPEHPDTLVTMQNLADAVATEGRFADAEKMYREVTKTSSRVLGPEFPHTLEDQSEIAGLVLKQGRIGEAERLYSSTLAQQIRVLGPENPDTLTSRSGLVRALIAEHRYDRAEPLARQNFEIQSRTLGPLYPDSIDSLQLLATALARSGHYGEAQRIFEDVLVTAQKQPPKDNPWRAWYAIACVAADAGHADDAINNLREAVDRGYKDVDGLTRDDDLKNLRQDPRFIALAANLRR